jgi:hypothetical protein
MPPEERSLKKYLCGYEACQSRECFDTWKHIQQHYKNYHKVTVKKKDTWDESIPKIRKVDMNQAEEDAELLLNMTGLEQLKRKRSARTDGSTKAQKILEHISPASTTHDDNNTFAMLLSNATILAKLTKDFTLLKNQIKVAVLPDEQDPSVLSSVNGKLKELNEKKLSLERTIEIGKSFSQEFNPGKRIY